MDFKDILKKVGISGQEDDDLEGLELVDEEEPEKEPEKKPEKKAEEAPKKTIDDVVQHRKPSEMRKDNVVNIAGAGGTTLRENVGGGASLHVAHPAAAANMKVVVIQPRSLDDSQQIANCLKEKRPVVINFEGVDDQLYRRILDFVSGTTYALDGNVNSISTRVWLFSPKNVNVSVNKQNNTSYSDMPWEKK